MYAQVCNTCILWIKIEMKIKKKEKIRLKLLETYFKNKFNEIFKLIKNIYIYIIKKTSFCKLEKNSAGLSIIFLWKSQRAAILSYKFRASCEKKKGKRVWKWLINSREAIDVCRWLSPKLLVIAYRIASIINCFASSINSRKTSPNQPYRAAVVESCAASAPNDSD